MNVLVRPRVLAAAMVWAVVYNLIWILAWVVFMRREWTDAMVAIRQPMPWTPQFWAVWVVLTVPFGVAIMAYVASQPPAVATPWSALAAGLAVWALMTVGMTRWGWQDSHPIRVIAMDAAVNLIALLAATFAGAWGLRHLFHRSTPPQIQGG